MTRFQSYKRFAKPPPQAMPRPKVWGDFTEDASFEGEDDAGDDLVEFTCLSSERLSPLLMQHSSRHWRGRERPMRTRRALDGLAAWAAKRE